MKTAEVLEKLRREEIEHAMREAARDRERERG